MEKSHLAASSTTSARAVVIGDVTFGRDLIPVIAGPCSVERNYLEHAKAAARAGASILRGSIFKPRSAPGRFHGIGAEGIPLLIEAREATGLPILSEPLDPADVDLLLPHVQAFLIGTRSMRNSRLLEYVGAAGLPVVLKRAFSATYAEWLGAADYVKAGGNENVILCERGIRTFEAATRNTLDLSAVPVLHDLTDLPIIVDPSHAAGRREWVLPLATAAAAAGADGLLVESHPNPEESLTDKEQALTTNNLSSLVSSVRAIGRLSRELRVKRCGMEGCDFSVSVAEDIDNLSREPSLFW